MNNYQKSVVLLCIFCIVITFSSCTHNEEYKFALYTKDEVLSMYDENADLFLQTVMIKDTVEGWYEKGLIDEYEHVLITSPYAKEITYLNDEEKAVLNKLFELKPYMIKYHRGGLYVAITFINSDATDAHVLSFWTYTGENSDREYEEYKSYLAQYHIVEEVTDGCIIWYTAENVETKNSYTVSGNSVEEFIIIFSDESSLPSNKVIVSQALSSTNLYYKNYKIDYIVYESKQDDNGEFDSFVLRLRWHNRDSALRPSYKNEIELKLLYNKDGIDAVSATNGYSPTDTADFFTRDIGNNKTEYLLLLNDNYFCEYFVDNSLADKVSVAEQLKLFCLELDNIIVTEKN